MIGQTISHYRILSKLGSGGMGVVYEAEDVRLGRHVAIKFLPAEACCDPQAMDRFLREARTISSLNHPHICTLHDIGEHDGQQFMVMELLEGEPLNVRIARGPLPLDDLLEYGIHIADALDAAHSAGVIHRDIKPANLFISRRPLVKILDFGVAKLTEAAPSERADLDVTQVHSNLTTTGSAIGTIVYMSPEQARGQEIDARSDLFSFGSVLYEMATGRAPFAGQTQAVIFEGILTKQPPPPSQLNANVPLEFDHIVAKALEKDRETRYQSASEMRADLKRLKRDSESGRFALGSGTIATAVAAAPAPAASTAGPLPAATGVQTRPAAPRAAGKRALLVGAPLVMIAAVGGFVLWQSQRTPALAERDTVVLADFTNRTGDAMFDATLSEALGVQLRQSPFLNLLPEQQVQATLRLMGRQPTDAVTSEVGREVCQRAGAKAVLGGTIANIGNTYLITLNAQNCVSGEILAEEQSKSEGKDGVLTALGDAASQFREKLGESLASVQRYDANIEQATTRSLDALKAYSVGMTARRTQGDFESLPFFRQAVQHDPDFALAHARLGTVLGNVGEPQEAAKSLTRAFELREKVSDRERYYIEARYHTLVTRDTDKAIEAYRVLLATYPDDYAANSNLGTLYRNLGRPKEALQHLEQAVRLAPTQPLGHLNLAGTYIDEERFAEGKSELLEVLKLQESMSARVALVVVGTMTGDQALVDAQVAAAKGQRAEYDMVHVRALAAGYKGQMKEAGRLAEQYFQMARDLNRVDAASETLLGLAINQGLTGRTEQARIEMERVLKTGQLASGALDEVAAFAALIGNAAMARDYAAKADGLLEKLTRPDDVPRSRRAIQALVAFAEKRYQEAYDLASANAADANQSSNLFLAGLAALELQHWDDAAKMFAAHNRFAARVGLTPRHAVSRIMLGRAHAGAGRTAEALHAYDGAFAIWKDADSDLPLLREARNESERLRH